MGMHVIIVSGMSGGGRSMALRRLEDLGYFCVDNMPPQMIAGFIDSCMTQQLVSKIALVVDTRAGVFFDHVYAAMDEVRAIGAQCDLLFLETSDEVLIRRYKESRRRHPLSATNITSGITTERVMLRRLRERATYIIDTSNLLPRQFNELMGSMFGDEANSGVLLPLIVSFGYKNGLPLDADLVFDVRFLPNPFYDPALRPYNGLQEPIRDYVFGHEVTQTFTKKLLDMVTYLLPHYQEEGKSQLVIGIGCTGGMHRSVAIGQWLHEALKEQGVYSVVQHRDIGKDAQRG